MNKKKTHMEKLMSAVGGMRFYGEPSDLGIPSFSVGELVASRNYERHTRGLIIDSSYDPHMGWTYDVLMDGILYEAVTESIIENQYGCI